MIIYLRRVIKITLALYLFQLLNTKGNFRQASEEIRVKVQDSTYKIKRYNKIMYNIISIIKINVINCIQVKINN